MSTVSDVIAFLEKLAPPELAEEWDNTGLLVGHRNLDVEAILTCLTLTPDVAAEAIERGVQLIICHHPVMFRGVKQITDANAEGRMLLVLIEKAIAVYSPHTSFDSAATGINHQLAGSFGLKNIVPMRPHAESEVMGGGRIGQLAEPIPLQQFLGIVRAAVAARYMEYCGKAQSNVSKVGVACGSAASFLDDAMRLGCDTFVTGEARFHTALDARAAGVNLVLLGHYSSERPAVEALADVLMSEFSGILVHSSNAECDPLSVYPS